MGTTNRAAVRVLRPLRDFLHTEAAGGTLLVGAAAVALVWANSPWRDAYHELWDTMAAVSLGSIGMALDLRHWVNDAAMTLFFLVVGLEIRRETATGHLADRRAAALPLAAAVGGMAVPALLYLAIAGRDAAQGWGVPMATDIALAVGVLALAGSRVPQSLRAFLLGLAVVDDIGAIIVIAVFYSKGTELQWLGLAAAALAATLVLRRVGMQRIAAYVALGIVLWVALHEAGVHPTLAGVAMGLLAPTTPRPSTDLVDADELDGTALDGTALDGTTLAVGAGGPAGSVPMTAEAARLEAQRARDSVSTVEWLQHVLHPWTSYLVVPVFALANAGIEVSGESLRSAAGSAVTWGIVVGLLAGKPLGVLLVSLGAIRSGVASRPEGTTLRHLTGAGAAAGIGFTVALFIAELAFTDEAQLTDAKMGILVASVLSGLLSLAVLRRTPRSG
ncbi:MAG: Na+/H+ antiporter NhaA [Ilumatobacteraceae bacterium]